MIAPRTFDEALLYVCPDVAQRAAQRAAMCGCCGALALLDITAKNKLLPLLPDLRRRTIADPPVSELNIQQYNSSIWASRSTSHSIFQRESKPVQIKWNGAWHIQNTMPNAHLVGNTWHSITDVIAILPCGAVLHYVNKCPAMYNPTNGRRCWLNARPRTYRIIDHDQHRYLQTDILLNDYGEPCVVKCAAFSACSKMQPWLSMEP